MTIQVAACHRWAVAVADVLFISNLLFDSGLSQNIISQVARHDRDSNRKSVAAAHALHGDARSSILYMAKLNAAVGVKGNAIGECNLRRNFPKTGSDGLVAWSLGHHVKRIARHNPHTAFT